MHISYTFDLIHDDIVSLPTIHTHYDYDSMLNVVTKCKNGMDSLRTFDGGSYFWNYGEWFTIKVASEFFFSSSVDYNSSKVCNELRLQKMYTWKLHCSIYDDVNQNRFKKKREHFYNYYVFSCEKFRY